MLLKVWQFSQKQNIYLRFFVLCVPSTMIDSGECTSRMAYMTNRKCKLIILFSCIVTGELSVSCQIKADSKFLETAKQYLSVMLKYCNYYWPIDVDDKLYTKHFKLFTIYPFS